MPIAVIPTRPAASGYRCIRGTEAEALAFMPRRLASRTSVESSGPWNSPDDHPPVGDCARSELNVPRCRLECVGKCMPWQRGALDAGRELVDPTQGWHVAEVFDLISIDITANDGK